MGRPVGVGRGAAPRRPGQTTIVTGEPVISTYDVADGEHVATSREYGKSPGVGIGSRDQE